MIDRLRHQVLTLLRVPPEPQVPEGSPGSILVFRPGLNFYRWQLLVWFVSHFAAVAGLIIGYSLTFRWVARAPAWVQDLHRLGEAFGLVGILLGVPFTFVALRWDYEMRWYMVTDRSLRIRRGVWNVEEVTTTFANIQEIRVSSGPVQGYLGLADVEVHSAGGGTPGPHGQVGGHKATFEGVANAEEIRDLIASRVRQYRDLGLGGTPHTEATTVEPEDALTAARQVLAEAQALRRAVQSGNLPAEKR